ncbi:DUF397 domain-containing protein [Actinocorallia populi]|uniref:DUF397 domain-containing protein n=1 Tax=Actinocorallia populi TaxID=2079200 RepID=UPI000D097082|nr:DUF397 domain-containing protein [Actinocorallia populi]
MPSPAPPALLWRKSSRSGSDPTSNCVELAAIQPAIAVRDSKHPDGPALRLSPTAFRSLLQALQGP